MVVFFQVSTLYVLNLICHAQIFSVTFRSATLCAQNPIPSPGSPRNYDGRAFFELSPTRKGLISVIYQGTMSLNNDTLPKLKSKWEGELGMILAADWWTLALARVNSPSSCARLSLIQLKVFHRAHLSKSKLHEIYPDSDPQCDRCHTARADLSHMFWFCPKLTTFWSLIFDLFAKLLKRSIKPCPCLAILEHLQSPSLVPPMRLT